MTTNLLIKEFIELGRKLGSVGQETRDAFTEFLSGHGYNSLNDYHASSDSDEEKQSNYKLWFKTIEDEGKFSLFKGAVETYSESQNNQNRKEEAPIEAPVIVEEQSPLEKLKADPPPDDMRAVLQAIKDGVANMRMDASGSDDIRVGILELKERYDRAIEVLSNAKTATETKLDKCWSALRSHETSEALHGGGAPNKFSIHVVEADKEHEGDGPLHYKFPLVSAAVLNRIPTMIVGPAGWGKTSMIRELGSLLMKSWDDFDGYRIQSIGPQTSKSDILGYMDANGKYVESVFYQCFSRGMLYACDEADAGSAGSLTLLNQGFANTECNFPGQEEMTARHENFVPMFLANTYGQGANATYVGRNQLDAATLDRFAVVEYDYDEAWEGKIIGVERQGNQLKIEAGGTRTPDEWMDFVCRIRRSVDTLAVRHVVSPRATINGIKLLKAGLGFTHVANMCVWKGLDSATRVKVMNEADGE